MAKTRLVGSDAKIKVKLNNSSDALTFMEVDKFTAKAIDEIKESMPLGFTQVTHQNVHKGWDLTFEGGLVSAEVGNMFDSLYEHIQNSKETFTGPHGVSPVIYVNCELTFANDQKLTLVFEEVSLHDLNIDVGSQNDEIKQSFNGKARSLKIVDGQATTVRGVGIPGILTQIMSKFNQGIVPKVKQTTTIQPDGNNSTRQ